MPSWQARLFSKVTWFLVKRRAHKPVENAVERALHVRHLFEPPEFLRPSLPEGVQVRPVRHNGIAGEWVEWPLGAEVPQRTVYYLHGGGYIACSPRTHRGFTAHLSHAANARVFALDYRRAPEHKFPAALEDAVSGYRFLLENGEPPGRIVIGGDSAGGGLTVATLIALRDRGLPLPSAAFLLSPWTDLAATGNSLVTNEEADPLLSGKLVHVLAQLYYGQVSPRDPLVSPLYGDLIGLPPMLIYVSDTEILLDDSTRLAERARRHGVKVDLRVWNNLPHVWPVFVMFNLPESRQAIAEIAEFINQQTSTSQAKRSAA